MLLNSSIKKIKSSQVKVIKRSDLKVCIPSTSTIEWLTMAAIPQGMFAAFKVRQNMEANSGHFLFDEKPKSSSSSDKWGSSSKQSYYNQQSMEHPPAKYNSKMMNSIWGQYNRYSVHNMKKVAGDANALGLNQQQATERINTRGSPSGQNGNNGGKKSSWDSFLSA